jgi:hypothetical protein
VYEINNIRGKQLAIKDFLRAYGTYEDLVSESKLDSKNIIQASLALLN